MILQQFTDSFKAAVSLTVMATLREVRNRISGVKKTQKITRAMKMVAAAKAATGADGRGGGTSVCREDEGAAGAAVRTPRKRPGSLLVPREVRMHSLVVVVTSDRGFCGAFNSNLLKAAVAHFAPGRRRHPDRSR